MPSWRKGSRKSPTTNFNSLHTRVIWSLCNFCACLIYLAYIFFGGKACWKGGHLRYSLSHRTHLASIPFGSQAWWWHRMSLAPAAPTDVTIFKEFPVFSNLILGMLLYLARWYKVNNSGRENLKHMTPINSRHWHLSCLSWPPKIPPIRPRHRWGRPWVVEETPIWSSHRMHHLRPAGMQKQMIWACRIFAAYFFNLYHISYLVVAYIYICMYYVCKKYT